jgi:hypothetical protein
LGDLGLTVLCEDKLEWEFVNCYQLATFGIWSFVDWIVALVKAYSTYNDTEDITFINGGYSR